MIENTQSHCQSYNYVQPTSYVLIIKYFSGVSSVTCMSYIAIRAQLLVRGARKRGGALIYMYLRWVNC